MIPILYESDEIAFTSNGICRLRDCISCTVTEERNGIYECDFEYPVDGAHFDDIRCGRIVAVWHDDAKDVQPFDIVSYTKPLSGVVTFHAVHISYRQSGLTVYGTNINSLADAFTLLGTAQPSNQFAYTAGFTSSAYMAAADGVPHTVRSMLGGMEGSILDSYGGEYEWDRFNVILHKERGTERDFTIRYGLNLLDYNDETDYSGSYSSCIPYWKGTGKDGNEVVVVASRVDSELATYNGRNVCIPLDLTDKFEDKPTKANLRSEAASMMSGKQVNLPAQTISVDFVRLQDFGEYEGFEALLQCKLCDTIKVVFPRYNMQGRFKIVKTVYNVLSERYDGMELGNLSTTLAEALGITSQSTLEKSAENIYKVTSVQVTVDPINSHMHVTAASRSMDAVSGYNAVGIVGWASSNWRIRPTTHYIASNTSLYAGFANTSATDVTTSTTITFRVLWMGATSE